MKTKEGTKIRYNGPVNIDNREGVVLGKTHIGLSTKFGVHTYYFFNNNDMSWSINHLEIIP